MPVSSVTAPRAASVDARFPGAALPALAVALTLLPAFSPVAAAEEEFVFAPEILTECEQAVQQTSAASSLAPDLDQCVPPIVFGYTADVGLLDGDGDGLFDDDETSVYGTDPFAPDSDFDGV